MTTEVLANVVAALIVFTAIACLLAVVIGVRRLARMPGVLSSGPDDQDGSRRIARVDRWLAGALAVWVGGALVLSFAPLALPALLLPLLIVALAASAYWLVVRTASGQRLLAAVPQSWLIGAQVYRIVGGAFLLAATYGALPGYFAIPAGWGDLFVGVSAMAVALLWFRRRPLATPAAWAWNAAGLADLVIAVGIGSSLLVRPAAAFFGGSPAWMERAALGYQPLDAAIFPVAFPLVLVPAFIVPLSLLLHVLSLRKLVTEGASSGSASGIAAAAA